MTESKREIIAVYETKMITPISFYDRGKREATVFCRHIRSVIYLDKKKQTKIINYRGKVFKVHKNDEPMYEKSTADWKIDLSKDEYKS